MEGNYKKWLDRINAKQDTLTEDNVGEFMDVKLSTKSTPTSGDTVLARDSLTGKAVRIPTSSFGGSGGGSGLVLGETSSTAYRGDRGKTAYDHSQITHDKNLVGLGNVDNTSDLNKPISTATQTALNSKQDKLQDATGNIGVGKTDASATEKLDVNGNVKASGFKKNGGTTNQALTADGGVFDLNTKADLVGGKVPKAQSQPSTMAMDNSTYIITFTDATGAVQTIDLPLESLFKDANYDAQTKSLIVTLQDGTTRTIPLTDLVDLPEIVLSNTNPSVNPTTGQKVYFNTSLGKVWFNVSEAWVFAGNLISDSEKTNLSNAYTHSQATGNPHNTTKADIGLGNVDNTSDLNKPISNATQNELNLKLSIESPSTTGTLLSFTTDKVYGTLTIPETGNITADVTNAKLGVTNIIIHNSGTAPTFGSQFKKLSGSGNYTTGVVNYIYCTFISATEIIYSINQRS